MRIAIARGVRPLGAKSPYPIISPDTNAKQIDSWTDQPSSSPISRPSAAMTAMSPERIGHTTRNPSNKPLRNARRIVRDGMEVLIPASRWSVPDGRAELQHVAVVVVDRKLAHAVLEVLHRVGDRHAVLQVGPERGHVIDLKVERPCEGGRLEWDMGVRRGDHHAHAVAAK